MAHMPAKWIKLSFSQKVNKTNSLVSVQRSKIDQSSDLFTFVCPLSLTPLIQVLAATTTIKKRNQQRVSKTDIPRPPR